MKSIRQSFVLIVSMVGHVACNGPETASQVAGAATVVQGKSAVMYPKNVQAVVARFKKAADRREVEAILRENKIEHHWDAEEGLFLGIMRNVRGNGIVSESFQFRIRMAGERVKTVTVEAIFTGP